jgi:hypothetical protein
MKAIYMMVSRDIYELPLAVADSIKELSLLTGKSSSTIRAQLSRARTQGRKSQYIKIIID